MRAFDFLATFIGGALVGAACGLPFAPEKGSDLREKIAEALRKRGIKCAKQEELELLQERKGKKVCDGNFSNACGSCALFGKE